MQEVNGNAPAPGLAVAPGAAVSLAIPAPPPPPATSAAASFSPVASLPDRLLSLQGLRALAISAVAISHTAGTRHFPFSLPQVNALGRIGRLGVRTFFVLSGFLITTLLLRERTATGRISLGRFYKRRLYRIMPPFLAFVLAMIGAHEIGLITVAWRDVLAAVTQTMNFHYHRSWYFGHLWSLSVEQQFYLLWPVALVLVGVRRALWGAAAMLLLAPAIRVAVWLLAGAERDNLIDESFPCIADAIATGCLLAGLRGWLGRRTWYLHVLAAPWFWLVPAAIWLVCFVSRLALAFTVDITLMNLAIALCIDRLVRFPTTLAGRVLNSAPLVWLGTISYSVYLWQQPFLDRHTTSPVTSFPLNLALALSLGAVSYYLVERTFQRLRVRMEQRAAGAG